MAEIFAILENNAQYSRELLGLACSLDKNKKVLAIRLPQDASLYLKTFATRIVELIQEKKPEIVLFSASHFGRELAPRVSSTLNTGLTADCTSLRIENDKLISVRPTFGGRLMAEILCKTLPQMATLRPGALKIETTRGDVEEIYLELPQTLSEQKILKITKNEELVSNLSEAKIVLAGGKGLKTKENFDKLFELAAKLSAKTGLIISVGATRGAVEASLAPKHLQIGQTGISIVPETYIAFGISGAIHHMVGVENAHKIIAINNDPQAPIFLNSDYNICEDALRVIDDLLGACSVE